MGDDGGSRCNMMREEGCIVHRLAAEQRVSVPLSVSRFACRWSADGTHFAAF